MARSETNTKTKTRNPTIIMPLHASTHNTEESKKTDGSCNLPRLGISQCLLGDEVRYDGGHKRDRFLTQVLGHFVEWVPICPEVEAGLGTPREAMRLVGDPHNPRLLTINRQIDHTSTLRQFCARRIREIRGLGLDGYVFKKDSPSCGIRHVRVYRPGSQPTRTGVGLFAQAFHEAFPFIPIEDEGRLNDQDIRENFVQRIFGHRRWRNLFQRRLTRGAIVQFHTQHKYMLLAHSRPHYHTLGRLVASAQSFSPTQLATQYRMLFMEALKVKATIRKHVNVLQHLVGHFKHQMTHAQKIEVQEVIAEYHQGFTPLIAPLTLINHYIREFKIDYLAEQVYIQSYPKRLITHQTP